MNPPDWRFSRYADAVEGWCSRPSLIVDVANAGEWHLKRCGAARSSRCATCAEIHQGDVAAVGRSGWSDRPTDRAYFFTLTAPGADVLPWDRSQCVHSSGVPCGGPVGCVVEPGPLAVWHDDIGKRWSRVIEDARRELNPGETSVPVSRRAVRVDYMRTWEPQRRGALHAHSMCRVTGPASDARFRSVLRAAAIAHGFGEQVDIQQVDISDPEQAARRAGYVAKYSTKCADALPAVRRLNPATGEIRLGGIRSWSASRQWGDTITAMHLRRCQWATGSVSGRSAAPAPTPGPTGALDSYQDHSATVVRTVSYGLSDQPL